MTLAVLFGTLLGAGALLVVLGLTTSPRPAAARPARTSRWSRLSPTTRRTVAAGASC